MKSSLELFFFKIENLFEIVSVKPPLFDTIGNEPLLAASNGKRPRGSSVVELATAIKDFYRNFKTFSLLIKPNSLIEEFTRISLLDSSPIE